MTKHRGLEKPKDEQLHVLPLYVIDDSDEFGNEQDQNDKFKNGSIEMLSKYVLLTKLTTIATQASNVK